MCVSFIPRDFVQIASDKPFNYQSGLELLLTRPCFRDAPNSKNDSSEDSEVDNHLE